MKGNHIGELAEWSNAAVLKTVDLNGSGGSNPSLSAKHKKKSRQVYLNAIFCLCFATPRRRRGGMCERSEQIPESEGLIQRQLWPFNLQGPRGKRPGMCDHREQIPPSEVSKYCESTARNFKELQYALIINSWII